MNSLQPSEASKKLRDGEVIIAELDNMLALICDARNDEALQLMRKLKSRGTDKGFSILMDSDARLNRYVKEIPSLAWDIFDSTSHDPVILILPKGHNLSQHALASDGSIAVRMVTNPEEQKLVQTANAPIACTALVNTEGQPVNDVNMADDKVLKAIQYMLSLPTAKKHAVPTKIPVIKLGMDGEIKIIRG